MTTVFTPSLNALGKVIRIVLFPGSAQLPYQPGMRPLLGQNYDDIIVPIYSGIVRIHSYVIINTN